jgi:hypothetical protein
LGGCCRTGSFLRGILPTALQRYLYTDFPADQFKALSAEIILTKLKSP